MVKAAKESATARSTMIKIGDKWLNVATWARVHPGGAAPIERYHGQDATVRRKPRKFTIFLIVESILGRVCRDSFD
jgi:cytochrome b involved in lipid metabolism